MRVVHFVVVRNVEHEIRLRKTLQWMKHRGCDPMQHGVVVGGRNEGRDQPMWLSGKLDGFPVFRVHTQAAGMARQLIEGLKPTIIHAHELAALWALVYVDGEAVEKPSARLIYEAHEYEPGRAMPFAEEGQRETNCAWERKAVPLVDDMIVVSPAIQDATERDHGFRPHLIPNTFMRRVGLRCNTTRDRVIAFSGNVTHCRGLEVAVPAIKSLGGGWVVRVFGDQRHEPTVQVLESIGAQFIGRLDYPYPDVEQSLVEGLASCDVGINLVDLRVPSYQMALPNKFFEYAMAGTPIVANRQADVARLIEEYSLGVVVDIDGHTVNDETVGALADGIRRAVNVKPRTEEFAQAWCWEATGGPVIDELYGLGDG